MEQKRLKLKKSTKNKKIPYIEEEEIYSLKKDKDGNFKLNSFRAQAFRLAQAQILAGRTRQNILEQMRELRHEMKLPIAKENYIVHIYVAAHKNLTRDLKNERDSLIALHINRYNSDIERLYNIDVSKVNKFKGIEMKTQAYSDLLDVLKQKEKLLGFHRREFKVKINNTLNATIKKEGDVGTFDLKDLSMEEKIELITLIDKSKLSDEDIFFNSLNEGENKGYFEDNEDVEELIQDIEFEDIKQDTEQKEEKLLVQQIKKPEPIANKPKLEKKSMDDVKAKLMAALMRANMDNGKEQLE